MRYIIGNIKMNQTAKDTKEYLMSFLPLIKNVPGKIGLCFPFTSLHVAKELADGTNLIIGAQNLHQNEKGAHCGEISADMLKSVGVSLVLIGHSERRAQFKEDNQLINLKIKRALASGLTVVFCYGETKSQRSAGKTIDVIKHQIEEALSGLYENELKNILFAYEPVWAISTTKSGVATDKNAEEVATKTREILEQLFSVEAAKNAMVLFGGSVSPKNAKEFLNAKGINGVLVGGASLSHESFCSICKTK